MQTISYKTAFRQMLEVSMHHREAQRKALATTEKQIDKLLKCYDKAPDDVSMSEDEWQTMLHQALETSKAKAKKE